MNFRYPIALPILSISSTVLSDTSISQQVDNDTWSVVTLAVETADIMLMASTYHPDAVVVSDKKTQPISAALLNWGEGMKKAAIDGSTASVSFRFKSRQDDEASAFEQGIFRYASFDKAGNKSLLFRNFETLLVKQNGRWLFLMERQLEQADKVDWDTLEQ